MLAWTAATTGQSRQPLEGGVEASPDDLLLYRLFFISVPLYSYRAAQLSQPDFSGGTPESMADEPLVQHALPQNGRRNTSNIVLG